MFVIRKKLYANEGSDPNARYDETEDCVQRTFDGGATWNCDESADPRTSPSFLNPASADDRCAGAQGVANFVSDFLQGAYQAFNIVSIASWAIQIGFFFTPITLFWRIAMLVGEGLISIGELSLQTTFDEEMFDKIRDIAFCWLDETGKFPDQAAFDGFGEQIQTDIGDGNVDIVMALMFNLYGWVGFSNAAIKYAESADCSGSDCAWCYSFVGTELGDWDLVTYAGRTPTFFGSFDGTNWNNTQSVQAGGQGSGISCFKTFTATEIREITFDHYDWTNGARIVSAWGVQIVGKLMGVTVFTQGFDAQVDGTDKTYSWTGSETLDEVQFFLVSAFYNVPPEQANGLIRLPEIRMRGRGDNPFGTDNC